MSDADLVKRMRATLVQWACDEPHEDWWAYQRDHAAAADRIAALEAVVARLRKRSEVQDRAIFAGFEREKEIETHAKALEEALRAIADGEGDAQEIAQQTLAALAQKE